MKLSKSEQRHFRDEVLMISRALLEQILEVCGKRADRKQEILKAAFVLSRIRRSQGNSTEYQLLRKSAAEAFNNLRPSMERTWESLNWEDICISFHYDFLSL